MEFSLLGLWQSMGLLARGVFLLLVGLSIFSLTVAIERWIVYRMAKSQSFKFAVRSSQYFKQNQPGSVLQEAKQYRQSHLAKVVTAGLLEYMSIMEDKGGGLGIEATVATVRRAIERAILITTADMKRGIGGLATVATTAPFIGLFGTVVGIINAFRGMQLTGSGGIGAVAGGIAEALVTTAVGLAVAIPAVWLFNYFTNKIERFTMEMSNASSELIDYLLKKQAAEEAKH